MSWKPRKRFLMLLPASIMTAGLLGTAACASKHPPPVAPFERGETQARAGYVAGVGGVRLFYRVDGGGLDTVVVLHGGPGLNLEGLRPDLTPFVRHHALLYFDQRGGGRSERPDQLRLTGAAMVEDIEAIRRAFHLERLTLLGHSWGGCCRAGQRAPGGRAWVGRRRPARPCRA